MGDANLSTQENIHPLATKEITSTTTMTSTTTGPSTTATKSSSTEISYHELREHDCIYNETGVCKDTPGYWCLADGTLWCRIENNQDGASTRLIFFIRLNGDTDFKEKTW